MSNEIIHHQSRYGRPQPISCGETGRVRVTYTANDVTCEACKDADAKRLGIPRRRVTGEQVTR